MIEIIILLIAGFVVLPRLFSLMAAKAEAESGIAEAELELARAEAWREALLAWRRRGFAGECPELEDIDYPDDEGEVKRLVRQATRRMDSEPEGSR